MRGRTRPYEERDTSLRREGRVPKIHVRICRVLQDALFLCAEPSTLFPLPSSITKKPHKLAAHGA